jgi:predicted transcriptional regulator
MLIMAISKISNVGFLPCNPPNESILGQEDDLRRDEDTYLIINTLSEIDNHLRSQKTVKRDQIEPKLLSLLESVFLKVLAFCEQPQSRLAILEILKLYNNSRNFDNYIKPLIEVGWLNLTLPNKPTSKNQQYYTTELGKKLLTILTEEREAKFKRIPVESSTIAAVGYDKEAHILEIEFHHGAIYQYANVPEKVFDELMSSPSQGAYFLNEIKGRFEQLKN